MVKKASIRFVPVVIACILLVTLSIAISSTAQTRIITRPDGNSFVLKPSLQEDDCGLPYVERGNFFLRFAAYETARDAFTDAITQEPNCAAAYIGRGVAHYRLEDFIAAIEDYDQALALDPDNIEILALRGLAYFDFGDFDAALADALSALQSDPNNPDALNLFDLFNLSDEEIEQVILGPNGGAELDPDDYRTFYNRGLVYYGQEQFEEAVAELNIAIELNPDVPALYLIRGDAHLVMGNQALAFADFYTYEQLTGSLLPFMESAINRGIPTPTIPPTTSTLIVAGTYTGNIPSSGSERWIYEGLEREVLTVIITATEGDLKPNLFVYNSDDEIVWLYSVEPPLQRQTITQTFALDNTDTYELIIGSWQGQTSGTYTLTIESDMSQNALITPTATPASLDLITAGNITGEVPLNGAENWFYQGTVGEIITIAVEPDTAYLDPILLLLDKDGNPIASAEGLTVAIEDFELTENSIYQIVVGSWEGQTEGEYTLIIESSLGSAATPTP